MATPSATAPEPGRASSLTDWLRDRSDDQLAELLRRRPDLALPAPADLAALASRVSVRTSVQRAVDGLDAFVLGVLSALVLACDGKTAVPVARARVWLGDGADVDGAISELLDLALVWGDHDVVHLVAPVADSLGPYPAGLGRPAAALFRGVGDAQLAVVLRTLGLPDASQPQAGEAVAALLASARLADLLATCDPAERDILDRLAAGPPVGTVRDVRAATVGQEASPVRRLIAHGLLVALDAQSVELPREVSLALRAAGPSLSSDPPQIAVVDRSPVELDRLGTSAVLETLRLVDAIADVWTLHPPAVLRTGGVGVRDLRRTARTLGVDEPTTALIVEIAYAAGLIGPSHGVDPVYLPSVDYDTWRAGAPAQRWVSLAAAWLAMTRQPSLISQRGERDRLITALSPDVERGTITALRTRVLDVLSTLPPGAAPADRAAVLARLAWDAPRRAGAQRQLAEAILGEADLLGLTAAGGLTGYSRTLLHGSRSVAEQVLAGALPEPVDHFVLQPDLTIVVPGPPTPDLATELALVADLESTGGANVYRITEASVRRALDAGRSGTELTRLISVYSRTPVPQALSYLISDAARRHGVLRTGAAAAYLRCDDEALLSRVIADRATHPLHLRRIAPTIAISSAPVGRTLEVLRAAGFAPAAESGEGEIITLAAEPARAPARPAARSLRARAAGDPSGQLSELVHRIRSGEAMTGLAYRINPIAQQIPGVTSATTMGLLREAIRAGRRVWLGYASPDGTSSRHTILPISMGGGVVRGHEAASQRLQSFALHRLTAVSMVDEDILADAADDDGT